MGISKTRFVGDNHTLFICPLCDDVADDPKLVKCCESIVCSKCHDDRVADGGIYSIPSSCDKEHDIRTEKCELQKQLRLLYLRLKVKCSNDGCKEPVTLTDVSGHESICSFRVCPKCKYKNPPDDHDCVRWLLDKNSLLKQELSNLKVELKSVQKSEGQLRVQLEKLKKLKEDCGYSSNGSSTRTDTRNLSNETQHMKDTFVFNSNTTASAKVKNMIQQIFNDSTERGAAKRFHMTRKAIFKTGKSWVIKPKERVDLGRGDVPSDTFCSFMMDGKEIYAFQGDGRVFVRDDNDLGN